MTVYLLSVLLINISINNLIVKNIQDMEYCPEGKKCQQKDCTKVHRYGPRHNEVRGPYPLAERQHGRPRRFAEEPKHQNKKGFFDQVSDLLSEAFMLRDDKPKKNESELSKPIKRQPTGKIENPEMEKKEIQDASETSELELAELSQLLQQHNISDQIYMMNEQLTKQGHSNTISNLGVLKHLEGDLTKSAEVLSKAQKRVEMKQSNDQVKYNLAILRQLGFCNKQYLKAILLDNENDLLATIDILTNQIPNVQNSKIPSCEIIVELPKDCLIIVDAYYTASQNKHLSKLLFQRDQRAMIQCFIRLRLLLECTQDCWLVRPPRLLSEEMQKQIEEKLKTQIPIIGRTHKVHEVFSMPGSSNAIVETFIELQACKKRIAIVTENDKYIEQCGKVGPVSIVIGKMFLKRIKKMLPKGLAKAMIKRQK